MSEKLAWRPIDTAPREEDRILILSDGAQVEPGEWVPWGRDGFWNFCRTEALLEPTYWMPMPDAPYANDTKEAG